MFDCIICSICRKFEDRNSFRTTTSIIPYMVMKFHNLNSNDKLKDDILLRIKLCVTNYFRLPYLILFILWDCINSTNYS